MFNDLLDVEDFDIFDFKLVELFWFLCFNSDFSIMIDLSVFFKDLWEEFVCYMMIFDGILELGKLNDSSSLIVNNMEKYDVWCDDVEGICISDG